MILSIESGVRPKYNQGQSQNNNNKWVTQKQIECLSERQAWGWGGEEKWGQGDIGGGKIIMLRDGIHSMTEMPDEKFVNTVIKEIIKTNKKALIIVISSNRKR